MSEEKLPSAWLPLEANPEGKLNIFHFYSVADPEWFIPDPATFFSWVPDPLHILWACLEKKEKNLNSIKNYQLPVSAIFYCILKSYSIHSPKFTGLIL